MNLQKFWSNKGCLIWHSYDLEKGAGTFNPATFLYSLNKTSWNVAYVESSRRPSDGRYGKNPNRLQHYYQFQVVMKPVPNDIQAVYFKSLKVLGIDCEEHDIKFIEDNWESPTLGACGLGWEVWLDGIEITQFTYFQQIGGVEIYPILIEITYGLERLAMNIQKKNNIYDILWDNNNTYGYIHLENEKQWSSYNFQESNIILLKKSFIAYENEAIFLIKKKLLIPAYDAVIKCSHLFNLLEARSAIAVSERQDYILRLYSISKAIVKEYMKKSNVKNYGEFNKKC
jgi:glycyl-tRNA synthetase alpha chain